MFLIGRLHPLLVHFPIALVLAAAVAEVLAIATGRAVCRAVAVANLRAGAVLGALTAVAGWVFSSAPFVQPGPSLTWHTWTGLSAAAVAIAAAVLSRHSSGRSCRATLAYRVALFGAAALVALAGHLGGRLVWGDAFLNP